MIFLKGEVTSNDFEKRIVDILSNNLLSVSQISKKLGIRRDVVTGYCEALKNQGKLEFHRVGRSNVYTVKKRSKNE